MGFCVLEESLDLSDCWGGKALLELPNFLDSFLLLLCSCPVLPPFPFLLLSCLLLELTPTAGILGGRKGAREGAGIQWPMFPSFCLEEEGRERLEEGRIDFVGEEESFGDFLDG